VLYFLAPLRDFGFEGFLIRRETGFRFGDFDFLAAFFTLRSMRSAVNKS